ncbi:uncharacterized protein LOC124121356 isoform X3 [Haliotis rufescens]|uniref:uncharacterized protein LOC124121356 isoform X3 n=1 Tax=Haliotis rufescens TaxID=6454 RepID=UPI00201EE3A7|nr:uncharacterized protein LOC124121356 isoform X3 [Haliotis rufescens]
MQGYQHGQGQWPGGYDKGVSMIKQSGRAPENTPEWYREKETDSPRMSMVTHALKSLQDMRGGQSGKRPAEGLRGDFSGHGGVPDVKRSRYDSGGPRESMNQDQNDSWRCTKCNSKNIEGRNYCIHCYSSREVAELQSKSHAKVDDEKACTLYVFDLLLTTTTSDLFKYFSQWGGMIDVYVKIRDDGISSGKGLVQYRRREDAQAALAACPHIIQKKQILVSDKKGGDPWKRRDDMDKHKLYVTNIPLDVTQDELFQYFSRWGTIFSCEIVETERSRTNKIAFVSYTNEGDALKCLQSSHHLRNMELSVRVSVKSKSMIKDAKVPDRRKTAAALASLESHKLLATNVPPDVTEDELFQYFSMWGKLFSCEIIKNKERSRIRNKNSKLAFITYTKEEDALKCLQSRHNLRDRELFVHVSSKSKSMMRAAEDPKKVASAIASLELSLITLFVCNIPTDVTSEQLLEHFAKWGNIYACRIGGNYGRNNNFGYVCYNKKEDAMKSLNEPHILKDQKLFLRVSDTVKPINTDSKVPDRRKTASLERIKDARVPDRRRREAASASLERIKDARVPDRRRREAASASLERIKDARVPDQRRREAASASEESSLKIKLYVSYIPAGVTSNELLMHFSKWGIILKCTVEGLIGRDNGYGYVCYNSERDALKCLNEQHYMQGRKLSVRVSDESKYMIENAKDPKKTAAASESPESSQKITLFVSNIPPDVTSDDLLRHFSKHGKVNSCRIVGKIGNKDTKYGFVSFNNDKDAFRCLNVTHKLRNNWKLHLRVSDKSKPRDKTAIDTKNMSAVQKKNLNRRLFVNNVSAATTLKEVYDYFVKWGELSYYALRPTATNKLIAFVTYADMENALQCLNAVHFLNGNYLYVHCVTKDMQEPPRASDLCKSDVSRDASAIPARSPQGAPAVPARSPQGAPARPARSPQGAPAVPARSAGPSSPRQTSETFPSWREQRHCETVQPQRFPETFKSQRLHEVSHPQDAMEPQRLPEDVSRRMPEHFQSQRLPETFQSRRIPEDIHPQKLPEVYQPRLLPEDVKPRRQSSPEHFVPGLTPADSVSGTPPNIPLGTEYDCNVSGCFYKGTSLQFERHWTERHEAKVVDLICPFCSMGCVDADDFCEHLDFFHGIEDKIEMSKFLQMAKRQERDNIHFVMPGNVTKESCMRVAQPVQHEPTRLKAPPQQKTDAGECTFTGTMDESLNHWNKNHVFELIHLRCPICPKTFKKEASLKFHIKHVHPTIEMYSEKEPEDLEAYFEESQNFNLGSSQNETAFHDLQREVPKSRTPTQTISDVCSRSIHDGNRSTQTKPTASSSPPLQSGQNVPRPNLVPSLPTQQPVPRLDPPPLATHVPLPPLQLIQSQQKIVSAPPLMDRHPVPPPTDIPTKQAVPLLGVVTPFYPSTSVPNPVPPCVRPSVSTPQPAAASPFDPPASPQPSVTGIANTFSQKPVAAASGPDVSVQPHQPPACYSQTGLQPQESAQSHQAPIIVPPQPQIGAPVVEDIQEKSSKEEESQSEPKVTDITASAELKRSLQPGSVLALRPEWTKTLKVTRPETTTLDKTDSMKKKSFTAPSIETPKFDGTDPDSVRKFLLWNHIMMERLEDAHIKVRRRLEADVEESDDDDKEHLQQRKDNRGVAREVFQQRTDGHGRSRKEFQNRRDWNVEKEEHVEVYVDEFGNEDEEYALAYVDEDGVHVMDDGFVMGEGGPVKKGERIGDETSDMYHGIDQGSRSNRIREESRSHGQRGYGGGETRSGHKNLDERDMQIYKRGQEEYIEDDRFSEEEYLEYREDDRISISRRNSSHSMRKNEDRRSQRFKEQDSVLDGRRHFSPPLSRCIEGREDEFEAFEVSDELFDEGHERFVEEADKQGSIAHGKSSKTDGSVRRSGKEGKRGGGKDIVYVGTTKSRKMRSKWTDDEDDHEHSAKDKGTCIKDKNGKFQNRHFMGGKTQGDKDNSSKTKGQSLKNKEVTSEQVSRGNNKESKGGDNTEGNEGKQLEQEDDDISEGDFSGDGSICDMDDFDMDDIDMDDIDMDDFVIKDAV